MASVEKRQTQDGKISFRVKVRVKGYPTQTATFERLTDARKWGQQTETAIHERRHFKTSEAKKHTLADAIDRYIKNVLPQKPKCVSDQKAQLGWWQQNLGKYALADITPALIVEYRDELAKGITSRKSQRTPATVNRYLAVLSHLFTVAINEWGWLEDSPLRRVSKLKEPRGRVRFLSDEERERLLAAAKESSSQYFYLIIVLCLSTGARKMEILGLSWQNVDLDRGIITLHETKNGERRILPMVGRALELMKQHSATKHTDTDLVFPSDYNPKQPIDIRTPFETALKRAEITNFRFHDLRHSAASYLAMNGASMAEIAEVLGHKTLQMVKRYAHLSEAHTAKVVAKMNEKIFGGGDK